ncbi:MAG: PspC domain-containing protein [Ilumatobacter sp.]|nr:PspC domain-containing protein [Ilumatobacter sp.]
MDSPFSPPEGDLLTEDQVPAEADGVAVSTRHPDSIVAGVAATIADRLGLDPLWIRLGFVVLTLISGLGLLVYFGLWLVLVVGGDESAVLARIGGGAILLVAVPLMIAAADVEFASGPLALIALLGGLAVALWRSAPDAERRAPAITRHAESTVTAPHSPTPSPRRSPRVRREPTFLGQLTLGLAVIVAAAGALIDELNGGRMHPEQWLGAAGLVCGLGLLVGAVRGHARWLIVPALLFAVVGYGGGLLARSGVSVADAFGDQYLYVSSDSPRELSTDVGFGRSLVSAFEPPREQVVVDARMAMGELTVEARDDVAMEIRIVSDHVTVRRDGQRITSDRVTLGPDREPDVIVIATLLRGKLEIRQLFSDAVVDDVDADDLLISDGPPAIDQVTVVADGVAVTPDGWLVLGEREAIVTQDFEMILGDGAWRGDASFAVSTAFGEYLIIDNVLLTPDLQVFRLDDIRGAGAPVTTLAGDSPSIVEE